MLTTKLNNFLLFLNKINNENRNKEIDSAVGKFENPKFVGLDSLNKLATEKYNHLNTRYKPPSIGMKYEFHHWLSVSSLKTLFKKRILKETNDNNKIPNVDIFIFSFLKIKSRITSKEQQAIVITETNEK